MGFYHRQPYICYLIVLAGLSMVFLQFFRTSSQYTNFMESSSRVQVACNDEVKLRDDVAIPVLISEILEGKPIVLPQDDKRIINYIWSNNLMHPPSTEPYNLKKPNHDPSSGQGQFIRKFLKNMEKGFFVECGALDGETRSNTLFLEKNLKWNGLLVEGDPSNFELVKAKNRRSWVSNTCLSIKPYPHTATFLQSFNIGKIVEEEENKKEDAKHVTVQCMPLFTLLTALNITTVDYFSLDVEGSELQVLKTIPFDKIFIRTLSVENEHTIEGKDALLEYMQNQGYRVIGEVHKSKLGYANDVMFAHQDVEIEA